MARGNGLLQHSDAQVNLLRYRLLGTLAELYPERMAAVRDAVPHYRFAAAECSDLSVGIFVSVYWATGTGSKAIQALCRALVKWSEQVGLPVRRYAVRGGQLVEGQNVWVLVWGSGIARFLSNYPGGDVAAYCYESADPRMLNPISQASEAPKLPLLSLFEALPEIETEEEYLARVVEAHREYYREKSSWLTECGYSMNTRRGSALKKHLRWLAWYLVEGWGPEQIELEEGFNQGESNIRKALFGPRGLARQLGIVKETE